jgi:PcfJ-like protein
VPLDTVIEYMPLPLLWECGGLRFVALQTGKALHEEGAAMHHCVASYWQNVVNGGSRIYSILENGNRVATLELTGRPDNSRWGTSLYRVGQLVGTCNSRPAPEVAKAVGTFVEEISSDEQSSK